MKTTSHHRLSNSNPSLRDLLSLVAGRSFCGEQAAAREKHLDRLVGREKKLWAEVDALVSTKLPKCYDHALGILVDLRDLATRGKDGAFTLRMEVFREVHAKKPSFIQRLAKADL